MNVNQRWLDGVMQWSITWNNVDQVSYLHLASRGADELIQINHFDVSGKIYFTDNLFYSEKRQSVCACVLGGISGIYT